MLVLYETQQQLIEENILIDKLLEKKDQFLSFLDKKSEELPKKLQKIEKRLVDAGFDVDLIKKDAETAAGRSSIKNGKISNFSESINKFINDFAQKKYLVDKKKFNDEEPSLPTQVVLSIGLAALVFFFNTFFFKIFTLFMSKKLAFYVTAMFIGPIVEEVSKMFSVHLNFHKTYFVVFNAYEFTRYVTSYVANGMGLPQAILTRIPTILMHLLNTLIHVIAKKMNKTKEGLGLTVALHTFWNTLAVLALESKNA